MKLRTLLILLGIVAALFVAAIVGFVVLIFWGLQTAFTHSNVYKAAFEEARDNAQVRDALGQPVVQDGMIGGSMNTENDSGTADLTIPLKGSKSGGTLYVKATKADGMWTFTHIAVRPANATDEIVLPNHAPVP